MLICPRNHTVSAAYEDTQLPETCPVCIDGQPCDLPLVKFDGRKHKISVPGSKSWMNQFASAFDAGKIEWQNDIPVHV